MPRKHILITEKLSDDGLNILKEQKNLCIDLQLNQSPQELLSRISKYDALVIRSQTKITKEIIEAGHNLKLIARAGVGIDNVDINTAKEKGIVVLNTPTANSQSTAEMALSLMMCLSRKIHLANQSLRAGKWERGLFKGQELYNKTLGLIGFGNVGRRLAKMAMAFDMKVLVYDPFINKNNLGTTKIILKSLAEIFAESDIISLHCPLTEETKHIVNSSTLKNCKKEGIIINTARGQLINNQDLLQALDDDRIQAAGMDVFKEEPPQKNDPLVNHPKILSTPHIAASTHEAQEQVSLATAKNVIAFFTDQNCYL